MQPVGSAQYAESATTGGGNLGPAEKTGDLTMEEIVMTSTSAKNAKSQR